MIRRAAAARVSLEEGHTSRTGRGPRRSPARTRDESTDGAMTDETEHAELPRRHAPRLDETMSFEAVGAGVEPVPGSGDSVMPSRRWASAEKTDESAPWREGEAYVPRHTRRAAARGGGFTSGRFQWFRRLSTRAKLGVVIPVAIIALLLVVGVADAAATSGRVQWGVKAGAVPIGGLTAPEAASRIAAQVGPKPVAYTHMTLPRNREEKNWRDEV